jgi:two-component system, chemotaxis family, sensor kinase Cph1
MKPAQMVRTTSRPRVLIIEDDTCQAMALEEIVKGAGCEVIGPAGRLEDAVRLIRTSKIDAAFLDVHLTKDEAVFDAASLLKHQGIPFIFITAHDRKLPCGSGFKELCLTKPVERAVIEKMIVYLTNIHFEVL